MLFTTHPVQASGAWPLSAAILTTALVSAIAGIAFVAVFLMVSASGSHAVSSGDAVHPRPASTGMIDVVLPDGTTRTCTLSADRATCPEQYLTRDM